MPSANTNNPQNLGQKVAASVNPLYTLFQPTWVQLSHVREGTGGFLSVGNDSYIVPHTREWLDHSIVTTDTDTKASVTRINPNPRNPSPKLKARRKLARYENVASAILEAKKAVLFREQPHRQVGDDKKTQPSPIEQWWENIDGLGTAIDDAMPAWWDIAGTFGHIVLYFDVDDTDTGETAADQGWPYVRAYTPLDVLDWHRDDDGELDYIKLIEATEPLPTNDRRGVVTYRVRVADREKWTLYDYKTGKYISKGAHGLGVVPVVYLFGKRRALLPDIGESVLGDPRNYIDLFNLTSEIRELLRNQTFSFMNVPLGTGVDAQSVEQAQAMMGQQTGAMNVLFSAQQAHILSGDPSNVTSYHAEISRIKREIYRETGVQWESDSNQREAEGSIELKREDMITRIAAYADECEQAEYALANLWYRWKYDADTGPQQMDADQVSIHYPEHFEKTPFADVLEQAQAAQAVGMPAVFLKALRKAIFTKFEGMSNLSPEKKQEIEDAIDNAPDDLTPDQRLRQQMQLKTQAFGKGNQNPQPKPDGQAA